MELNAINPNALDSRNDDSILMGIDAEFMGIMTENLSRLYADAPRAQLREAGANAYDAQLEAGVTTPIKVTLPTTLDPFLRVQDFGIGMSFETLRTVYGIYGRSTKRSSATQTGGLGLGSKAPFAMSSTYMVTSVKDGLKNVAVLSRNSSRMGQLDIVSANEATTEPNGTLLEIPVPARFIEGFRNAAKDTFDWFPSDSFEVNGELVKNFVDKAGDSLFHMPGLGWMNFNGSGNLRVVMGRIGYEVKDDARIRSEILRSRLVQQEIGSTTSNWLATVDFYLEASMADGGDVDFVPSREFVENNDKTEGFIEGRMAEMITRRGKEIQDTINKASSLNDALDASRGQAHYYGSLTWQGLKLSGGISGKAFPANALTISDSYRGRTEGREIGPSDRFSIYELLRENAIIDSDGVNYTPATLRRHLATWGEISDAVIPPKVFMVSGALVKALDAESNDFAKLVKLGNLNVLSMQDILTATKAHAKEERRLEREAMKASGVKVSSKDAQFSYDTIVPTDSARSHYLTISKTVREIIDWEGPIYVHEGWGIPHTNNEIQSDIYARAAEDNALVVRLSGNKTLSGFERRCKGLTFKGIGEFRKNYIQPAVLEHVEKLRSAVESQDMRKMVLDTAHKTLRAKAFRLGGDLTAFEDFVSDKDFLEILAQAKSNAGRPSEDSLARATYLDARARFADYLPAEQDGADTNAPEAEGEALGEAIYNRYTLLFAAWMGLRSMNLVSEQKEGLRAIARMAEAS